MREALEEHPLVIAAARIGSTFHLDPVMILEERSEFRHQIRVAATNIAVADENKRNSKQ